MPHEHGFEYQVRIVYEDESEKLSGWMSCPEEAAHWISGPRRRQAKAYWLQVQDILCLNCRNCLNTGATIIEFPLAVIAVAKTRFPQQTESRLTADDPRKSRDHMRVSASTHYRPARIV